MGIPNDPVPATEVNPSRGIPPMSRQFGAAPMSAHSGASADVRMTSGPSPDVVQRSIRPNIQTVAPRSVPPVRPTRGGGADPAPNPTAVHGKVARTGKIIGKLLGSGGAAHVLAFARGDHFDPHSSYGTDIHSRQERHSAADERANTRLQMAQEIHPHKVATAQYQSQAAKERAAGAKVARVSASVRTESARHVGRGAKARADTVEALGPLHVARAEASLAAARARAGVVAATAPHRVAAAKASAQAAEARAARTAAPTKAAQAVAKTDTRARSQIPRPRKQAG